MACMETLRYAHLMPAMESLWEDTVAMAAMQPIIEEKVRRLVERDHPHKRIVRLERILQRGGPDPSAPFGFIIDTRFDVTLDEPTAQG